MNSYEKNVTGLRSAMLGSLVPCTYWLFLNSSLSLLTCLIFQDGLSHPAFLLLQTTHYQSLDLLHCKDPLIRNLWFNYSAPGFIGKFIKGLKKISFGSIAYFCFYLFLEKNDAYINWQYLKFEVVNPLVLIWIGTFSDIFSIWQYWWRSEYKYMKKNY